MTAYPKVVDIGKGITKAWSKSAHPKDFDIGMGVTNDWTMNANPKGNDVGKGLTKDWNMHADPKDNGISRSVMQIDKDMAKAGTVQREVRACNPSLLIEAAKAAKNVSARTRARSKCGKKRALTLSCCQAPAAAATEQTTHRIQSFNWHRRASGAQRASCMVYSRCSHQSELNVIIIIIIIIIVLVVIEFFLFSS